MKNWYENACDQAFFPGQKVKMIGTMYGKPGTYTGRTGIISNMRANGYEIVFDGEESPTMYFGHEELKAIGKKVIRKK